MNYGTLHKIMIKSLIYFFPFFNIIFFNIFKFFFRRHFQIQVQMSGLYNCSATNSLGTSPASLVVNLIVSSKFCFLSIVSFFFAVFIVVVIFFFVENLLSKYMCYLWIISEPNFGQHRYSNKTS